jgi:Ca2+-binding RTX toxin-like protein
MTTLHAGSMSGGGADVPDTRPPSLIGSPPEGQAANADLVFTFDEAILAGSGKLTIAETTPHAGTLFSASVAGNPAITIAGNTLTLHLAQPLEYAAVYAVSLDAGAVKDAAGNLSNETTFSFGAELSPVAVNLTGTAGNDRLDGSDLADTISGGDGNDVIRGHGGGALLNGGDEAFNQAGYGDDIDGGPGNDIIYGGAGNDYLQGGDGNDQLSGGAGDDVLFGDTGNFGSTGDDLLDGGAGNDRLSASAGQDTLRGGDGDDQLNYSSGTGHGLLDGGAGNDVLNGVDTADYVGGPGDDQITIEISSIGGAPTHVDGGEGNDRIELTLINRTTGQLSISGSGGIDTYVPHKPWGVPDAQARVDVTDFQAGPGGDLINVYGLLPTNSSGNPFKLGLLKLIADGMDTVLEVLTTNAYLPVLHLKNVQPAQLTADNFVGGIDPGTSTKGVTLTGTDQADNLVGGPLDDVLDGGAGNDTLTGGSGNDTLIGGPGDDTLIDDYGSDTLIGGDGNDVLKTEVRGYSPGTAVLQGGNGNDLLVFGSGGNTPVTASGGADADIFKFADGAYTALVTIDDFSAAQGDKLDLMALLPPFQFANPFASGYLKAAQSGSDVVISYDFDGAAGPITTVVPFLTLKNTDLATLPASAFVGDIDPRGSSKGLTITGTAGDDTLNGGWFDDTISGGAGADRIDGGPGNDLIDGGDETVPGTGDWLDGGFGMDTIHGGAGNDVLLGSFDDDILDGGDGNDHLNGNLGNDTLDGGAGNDVLSDIQGNNVLRGGAGDDYLNAVYPDSAEYYGDGSLPIGGDNTLDGGDGDDTLYAGHGNDTVSGGAGNDLIYISLQSSSNPKHIVVNGGDGDDQIEIRAESQDVHDTVTATGGAGRDTYHFSNSPAPFGVLTITDFQAGPGGDMIDAVSMIYPAPSGNPFGPSGYLRLAASGADTLLQLDPDGAAGPAGFGTVAVLEGVTPQSLTSDNFQDGYPPDGSSTGKTVTGTDGADFLYGTPLDDTIHGGAGNDTIDGDGGADLIHGDGGDDVIKSTGSHGQLFGDDGNDRLTGTFLKGGGSDSLWGGAGNDQLEVSTGDNLLDGGDGDDVLFSFSTGHNRLSGGAGNDRLTSAGGDDILDGGDGDDSLNLSIYGGDPSSTQRHTVQMDGGKGQDTFGFNLGALSHIDATVRGGADRDTYAVTALQGDSTITITDFQAGAGGDVIDLSLLLGAVTGNPFASGGVAQVMQRGGDSVVRFDPDGAGAAGFTDVLTLKGIDKGQLTADNFWKGFDPKGSTAGLTLAGTDGADKLTGGMLDDTITGGAGDDTLNGNFGNDTLDGGAGNDTIADDQVFGTPFSALHAYSDDDDMTGGDGDDRLSSYLGNDTLDGGAGRDVLSISDASGLSPRVNDHVTANGGDGDDVFIVTLSSPAASTLSVTMTGGAGADVYSLPLDAAGLQLTITDFQVGIGGDVLSVFGSHFWTGASPFTSGYYQFVQRGADAVLQYDPDGAAGSAAFHDLVTLLGVDRTRLAAQNTAGWPSTGPTQGQVITGTAQADTIDGTPLDDSIEGGLGDDRINGFAGNDSIDGGPGKDTLIGGFGSDTLDGGDGDDFIDATLGNDLARGGNGNDHLVANADNPTLDGGPGDDLLEVISNGVAAPHRITLLGGDGNDTFLVSEAGDLGDWVTATGGAGRDVFKLDHASPTYTGVYTVTDFQAGANGDLISLDFLASVLQSGVAPFGDSHILSLVQSGSDTWLEYNAGGNGSNDVRALLILKNVLPAALTADNFAGHVDPHPGAPTPTPTPTPAPAPAPPPPPSPPPPPPPPPPVSTTPAPVPGVTVSGGDSPDKLTGSNGDDKLDAGLGDDILHGGAGNDVLIGGDGRDTATYDGKLAGYTISRDASGWHVKDTAGGEGTDTLLGVERLQFADRAVALDLDGVAAQAYRIYRAAFDRTPDLAGLGYWISAMDKGSTVSDLASGFVHSKEFADLYGSAPSNADIVTRLYTNILHRAPDQAGYDYWVGILDHKKADLVGVLGSFSESAENRDAVADLIGNGIVFTPWEGG